MKIAGVVIWYNPTSECLENIKTYIDKIEKLYIIDNSNENNEDLFKNYFFSKKLKYIPFLKNMGVAVALNIGFNYAIKEGYDWILSMDQDSKFKSDITFLIDYVKKIEDYTIALVAPSYNVNGEIIQNTSRIMTSGSIINLSIYLKLGCFLEKLFIDEVDHEMCYRMILHKFKIIQLKDVVLEHRLGTTEVKKIFRKKYLVTNHSFLRRYYMARNKLYVRKLYPDYTKDYIRNIFKDIGKILLWEKCKLKKITYIFIGVIDYKKNKMGKFERKL